jgi:DNA-binding transcriptional LysR family regulator
VAAGLSSFIAPTRLVRGTDLLLTCLRSLAEEAVERDPDLDMHPLPLELPRVELMQIWHERTNADQLRRWFRKQVQEIAAQVGSSRS